MNVLVVSDLWLPFPGGAERLAFNIARDLNYRPDITVRVLTGYEVAKRFDGPPVAIEPIGIRDDHAAGAKILDSYLHDPDFRPDVVVTHHLYAYEFENEFARSGIPLVQIVLHTRRLTGAALGVFISDHIAETVGTQPGDLMMIPPAFDDVIATTTVAPFDRRAVGFIKPIPHKGVDLVYQIAALMPDVQFLVLRGEWQTLETLTTLPNVDYMDPVDDIATFYDECRIVLMPSVSEDAGTVAQECALNGIVCISSDVGGLTQTNAGGLRLSSRDPHDWVRVIRTLGEPDAYATVVNSQRAALDATGRDYRMDALAAEIRGLVGQVGVEPTNRRV